MVRRTDAAPMIQTALDAAVLTPWEQAAVDACIPRHRIKLATMFKCARLPHLFVRRTGSAACNSCRRNFVRMTSGARFPLECFVGRGTSRRECYICPAGMCSPRAPPQQSNNTVEQAEQGAPEAVNLVPNVDGGEQTVRQERGARAGAPSPSPRKPRNAVHDVDTGSPVRRAIEPVPYQNFELISQPARSDYDRRDSEHSRNRYPGLSRDENRPGNLPQIVPTPTNIGPNPVNHVHGRPTPPPASFASTSTYRRGPLPENPAVFSWNNGVKRRRESDDQRKLPRNLTLPQPPGPNPTLPFRRNATVPSPFVPTRPIVPRVQPASGPWAPTQYHLLAITTHRGTHRTADARPDVAQEIQRNNKRKVRALPESNSVPAETTASSASVQPTSDHIPPAAIPNLSAPGRSLPAAIPTASARPATPPEFVIVNPNEPRPYPCPFWNPYLGTAPPSPRSAHVSVRREIE